ncbi:UNVERIFIED_CONTAM: hypothetical protein GTU68_055784 [Idotea baltica]|nr:hypothetical protein [Idotea baltica]
MLAELTHRCPLQCGYCSNPVELLKANRELNTQTWLDTFTQAADLGILQVHLSGGEPTLRKDLDELIGCLSARGVYTNLITAAVTLTLERLETYVDAGLDHAQVSFQGAHADTTELIGHYKNAHHKKRQAAAWIRELGLPLTVNAPIHKLNIHEVPDFVALALELGAERLEIANVQYYGWAYLNRAALLPDYDAVMRQVAFVETAREDLKGILNIDFVTPDYYADYPKPCMGGWASDAFMITPVDRAACHAAQTIRHGVHTVTRGPGGRYLGKSEAFEPLSSDDPEPCPPCDRNRRIDVRVCAVQASP